MSVSLIKEYSFNEQLANSLLHGLGAVLSLLGLIFLVSWSIASLSIWHIVSYSIFGSTLFIMYVSSTLYHSIPDPYVKLILRKIDHATIYLLIAGTYTPFLLINLRGDGGWCIFGVVWSLAITGVLIKMFHMDRLKKLSVPIYIFMGWLCITFFHKMYIAVPHVSLLLLVMGGVLYTIGTVFYCWKTLPYQHAVWHVCVLGGSAAHYFAVAFNY